MKIALIGFANIYAMPYAQRYIKIIKQNKIDYDFIFWNREDINEKADNYYSFKKSINSSLHITRKILSFYKYYRYVLSILKQNQYDKIVVLYTIPAILLRRYLKKYYKNNYIFAYTDYTFENNIFYKKLLAEAVKNSFLTTITSYGFLRYLPNKNNIIIAHNTEDLIIADNYEKNDDLPISICYIGMLRNYNHLIKMINIFKNDNRFSLKFHGNGFCEDKLRAYIKINNIKNVFVYGKYEPIKKKELIQNADIINNSFANDVFQKHASTNRMYDAILNKKPQITTKGSYSQKIVEKYKLGFIMDFNDMDIKVKLFNWYVNLDYKKLFNNCEKFNNIIKKDINIFNMKLEMFLSLK